MFEKVKAERDEKGRRSLVPTGEPDQHFACDDVLVAVGQENAFPWIERDIGIEFDKWDMPVVDPQTMQSTHPKVFFGGDAAFGPEEHHLGGGARPRRRRSRSTSSASGEDVTRAPAAGRDACRRQKMGIHEWSYDNEISLDLRFKVPHREKAVALRDIKAEVELGFDVRAGASRRRERCLNCDVQTVFTDSSASSATPASTSARWTASPSRQRRGSRAARAARTRRRTTSRRTSISATSLKTGRIMVKDEDVCLHCGLCAERCPTGAWDMQRFLLDMAHAGTHVQHRVSPIQRVNDFVVKFANVNGSGSASANDAVRPRGAAHGRAGRRRATSSRPTSRACRPGTRCGSREAGHLGARGGTDLMVAMNPQTWDKDVAGIEPGGYLFYDSTKPMPASKFRDDINVIGVPLTEICNREYTDPRQRQLFKNIIYLGALSALLDIDAATIEKLIGRAVPGQGEADRRQHARAASGPRLGADQSRAARSGSASSAPTRSATASSSTATPPPALGAVYGGATVCAWYPITPSSSLAEAFTRYCQRLRVDPQTKENKFAIVQAEDELASIGMVIGAAWNGARAFTATSGPGISLMQEFLGLAYFAEIPAVIFDVQRAGPSTGMPTRTQQTDILSCAYASHGDTKHVLLFPEDPAEAFEFAATAFDLADRLQTPVFVMLDLDIGMNHHLTRPLAWDDSRKYDRGKVMTAADLEAGKDFGRYLDVDGDGIPYRTYPGTHPTKGSFFTRGTSRDRYARYTEEGAAYADNMQRLLRKFETAKDLVPRPLQANAEKPTKYGVIYFGSTSPAMDEAVHLLEASGHRLDRLRMRAFPFHSSVTSFIGEHDFIFIVEQNRDAQLRSLIVNECNVDPVRLIPILHYDGTPITARFIARAIADHVDALKVTTLRKVGA